MKKICLLFTFLITLFVLASCNAEDIPNNPNPTPTTVTNDLAGKTYEFYEANISYGSSVTEEGKKKTESLIKYYEYQLRFNEDDTYDIIVNETVERSGNYLYSNGKVIMTDNMGAITNGTLEESTLKLGISQSAKDALKDYVTDIEFTYKEKR